MDDKSRSGQPTGILRRLAALFYDLLLVTALAFAATFAMLPLTGGEALLTTTQGAVGHVYHATCLLVVFAYFGWCWTRGGQTLGLRVWRMRLESEIGGRLVWAGAALRFFLGATLAWLAIVGAWCLWHTESAIAAAASAALIAPLVLNFAWISIDREGRSLVDLACRSRVVRLN